MCDNLGGLNKSKQRRKKIPPSAKHADILRSLRKVNAQLVGYLKYQHVYGHQDRKKTWQQMSLLERLNYKHDSLAKFAVHRGILNQETIAPSGISGNFSTKGKRSAVIAVKNYDFTLVARRLAVSTSPNLDGTHQLLTTWTGAPVIGLSTTSLTCLKCGFSNRLCLSVQPVKIWVDGLARNTLVVRIAMHQTKMHPTSSIVATPVVSLSIALNLKKLSAGCNTVTRTRN